LIMGRVLVDEAGEALPEGADPSASALIRGNVLALEIAQAHEQSMCFLEHVFPAGTLGGNLIGPVARCVGWPVIGKHAGNDCEDGYGGHSQHDAGLGCWTHPSPNDAVGKGRRAAS
jgi:hypothetical protein